jgi:hypothetical protein
VAADGRLCHNSPQDNWGEDEEMLYQKPCYAIPVVNRAGRIIARAEDLGDFPEEKAVVDNWRVAHQYPLNALTMTLKGRASSVHRNSFVAQRIKRLPSIQAKLLAKPDMKLSQMQDVGGCRAVVPSIEALRDLCSLYFIRKITHPFAGHMKDYVSYPKDTGYRGIHLKFRYAGRGSSIAWQDLKIEMQLRTTLQHKWATAVEAAGTFTNAALKSNRGNEAWLRFFALMGSVYAIEENSPATPNTPDKLKALRAELRQLDRDHHIFDTFHRYSVLIPHIERGRGASYYLITLDPLDQVVHVEGFKKDEIFEASVRYAEAERRLAKNSKTQIVLVSVPSVHALKRAYPNYFMDSQAFNRDVQALLEAS